MGWDSYRATHYTKSGAVDRKSECDGYFLEGENAGCYNVLKSCMRGSVYYAAVMPLRRYDGRTDTGEAIYTSIPEDKREVFAAVCLTRTDTRDYFNFSMKLMDETFNPFYYDCPKGILDLLTPTDSERAREWREKCRQKQNRPSLSRLPVGTVIEIEISGQTIRLEKRSPAYQFKRAFWFCVDNGTYMPKTRIPENFKLISA